MNCDVKFNFIGISETGFSKHTPNQIHINGYSVLDCFTESTKGGTRLYISENFNFIPRPDLDIYKAKELESTIVEVINRNSKNFLVAVIYKHPNMDTSEFNLTYNNLIEKISSENKQAFIMGDFNIDLLKCDTIQNNEDFLQTNFSLFYKPTIVRPTRITPHSKTLIDNIFTNTLENFSSGNIITSVSDHLPQYLIVEYNENGANKTDKIKHFYRDFKNFNREDFILDYISTSCDDIFANKTPGDKMEVFITNSNELIDRHAPMKMSYKKANSSSKPWITQGLIKSIYSKNSLYRKFLKTKNPIQKNIKHQNFKTHRNLLVKLLKISKNNYYKEHFASHKSNLKLVWSAIKEVTNTKKVDNHYPNLLIHESNNISHQKDISNAFNNYFGSIAEDTKKDIPATHKTFSDFLGNQNINSFFLSPTSPLMISKHISQLDIKKASGPFSIPVGFLKIISPVASLHLSNIINECLAEGVYPDCLKKASIKPLHKKGSKLEVGIDQLLSFQT